MQQGLRVALAVLMACGVSFAEQTWTGRISTGMCGTAPMDNKCIQNCVKAGEKYVFVSKGKVFDIDNQNMEELQLHAGHNVKLTGELASDGKTIHVSKIVMPAVRK